MHYNMESNDKLQEIKIKNCTYYYFYSIIKIEDFVLDNILMDEKPYEKILVYDISYTTLIGAKPLFIRFDKVGEIRVYDGTTIAHKIFETNSIFQVK